MASGTRDLWITVLLIITKVAIIVTNGESIYTIDVFT